MSTSSLSVSQIKRPYVAYYAEAARLYGKKDELTIEDIRKLQGKANFTSDQFKKLIAGIKRSGNTIGKPFSSVTSPISTKDLDIDFVRPDIVRIHVKDPMGLKHLSADEVYYFDTSKPTSFRIVRKSGSKIDTEKVILHPKTDKLRRTGAQLCRQKGLCASELESPNKVAAKFGNITLSLNVILGGYSMYFRFSKGRERADVNTLGRQFVDLGSWMEKTSPQTHITDADGWLVPGAELTGFVVGEAR